MFLVALYMYVFVAFSKTYGKSSFFFFPSSFFLHYINIWGQKLQNPILRSISTVYLNQAEI